jgi:hypothetical protein
MGSAGIRGSSTDGMSIGAQLKPKCRSGVWDCLEVFIRTQSASARFVLTQKGSGGCCGGFRQSTSWPDTHNGA